MLEDRHGLGSMIKDKALQLLSVCCEKYLLLFNSINNIDTYCIKNTKNIFVILIV